MPRDSSPTIQRVQSPGGPGADDRAASDREWRDYGVAIGLDGRYHRYGN